MNTPNGEVQAVGRGRGPWRDGQNIELRRPQMVSAPSDVSSASIVSKKDDVSESLSVAVKSKLSVDAKEFVPRSPTVSAEVNDSQCLSNSYYDFNEQEEESEFAQLSSELTIQHLNEVIQSLTRYPGDFERLVQPLLNDLVPLLAVEESVEIVVTAIVNQAIAEQNFRYSAARLCDCLLNQSEDIKIVFRRTLFTKLCAEHGNIETYLVDTPEKVYGLVHFLAELYMQLEVTKGLRYIVLGDSLLQALRLLIQVPSVENIKNTCNILKLTGSLLDKPDVERESFFSELENLLEKEDVSERVKAIISNILKLRSDNWGLGVSAENSRKSSSSSVSGSSFVNEGVHYGPDHQALTAEEYQFLDDNCEKDEIVSVGDDTTVWDPDVNDSENAEIMAAFHEFIGGKHRP